MTFNNLKTIFRYIQKRDIDDFRINIASIS
ncbi:hypothetical protein MED222_05780 [Vibrio sp. MED222]|nr:hypothetical protein MED222_05780 [Vibrio sp. MED222]